MPLKPHRLIWLLILLLSWSVAGLAASLKTDFKGATVFRDLAPYNGRVDAEEKPAEVTDKAGRCKLPKARKGKKSKLTLIDGVDIKSGLPNTLSRLVAPPKAQSIGILTSMWQALVDRNMGSKKANRALGVKTGDSINEYQAGATASIKKAKPRRLSQAASKQTTLLKFIKSLSSGQARAGLSARAAAGAPADEDAVVAARAEGLKERNGQPEDLTSRDQVNAIMAQSLDRLGATVSDDIRLRTATIASQLNTLAGDSTVAKAGGQLDFLDAIISAAADLIKRGKNADLDSLLNYFATDAALRSQLAGKLYLTYPRELSTFPAADVNGILKGGQFTLKGTIPVGTVANVERIDVYLDGQLQPDGGTLFDREKGTWNHPFDQVPNGSHSLGARGVHGELAGAESDLLTIVVADSTATPSPTPGPSPTATPSPTPGPGPSPTPTPKPSPTPLPGTPLANDIKAVNLSGFVGAQQRYSLQIPAGMRNLAVRLSAASGDADLYVKAGASATTTVYDCASTNAGSLEEACFFDHPAGNYSVLVYAKTSFSGGTLHARWSASAPFNDSGITGCGDYANASEGYSGTWNIGLDCAGTDPDNDPIPPGQDAVHGRDAEAQAGSLTKTGGGHAGFDYTKIDGNGNALPASAPSWNCVRDNVSGLMWEVKTNDGGLHDMDWTYTWYQPDAAKNGGAPGTQNGGACGATSACDTDGFMQAVNAALWSGHSDWRMPSLRESLGLVSADRLNPAIDTGYFPNTVSARFWSSSPYAGLPGNAWGVSFNDGNVCSDVPNNTLAVRLVRAGQ